MVSRRSLLQASGAALAAGGLGMGLPHPAGAAESAAARPSSRPSAAPPTSTSRTSALSTATTSCS
ncbi:twin-arginine translocation signal domain-containing protein [Streptomyces aureus]|uniref:twin-arginine translocation signal domain-containing protein n=1 Tax=Streptomyces aureus TaxID=193461 RepID=UPI0036257EAA